MPNTQKPVDEIIADLPRSEQVIVKKLRAIILDCLPKAQEKNSYGVPFYRRNRMICFIWPPSIRWGPTKGEKEKFVVLGFCQGKFNGQRKSRAFGRREKAGLLHVF